MLDFNIGIYSVKVYVYVIDMKWIFVFVDYWLLFI